MPGTPSNHSQLITQTNWGHLNQLALHLRASVRATNSVEHKHAHTHTHKKTHTSSEMQPLVYRLCRISHNQSNQLIKKLEEFKDENWRLLLKRKQRKGKLKNRWRKSGINEMRILVCACQPCLEWLIWTPVCLLLSFSLFCQALVTSIKPLLRHLKGQFRLRGSSKGTDRGFVRKVSVIWTTDTKWPQNLTLHVCKETDADTHVSSSFRSWMTRITEDKSKARNNFSNVKR